MSTPTTHRESRPLPLDTGALAVAQRGAQKPMRSTEPMLHVVSRDGYRMNAVPAGDPLITSMRMVGRSVRLFFSRQDPERAQALAMELARSTSPCNGLDDPVRSWEPAQQVDRGLGHARRVQRLVNGPVSQSAHGIPRIGTVSTDSAADYLFASVMNLIRQMPLSDEAQLFRLWYLASRALNPPENALRVFGDLRSLPAHQQLAAGARLLSTLGSGTATTTSSHAPLQATPALDVPVHA